MADLFDDKAHARRTDPPTSHEAALAATSRLEVQRLLVVSFARGCGAKGFMDIQLEERFPDESDSGLRTRRSELAARNIILNTGRTGTYGGSARKRIIWVHRECVENAPDIIDAAPNAAQREVLRGEAHAKAAELATLAAGFRRQGYGPAADVIDEAAELLRKLARA